MIIEMRKDAGRRDIERMVRRVKELGFDAQLNREKEKTTIAVLGSDTENIDIQVFEDMPGIDKIVRTVKIYKLASRDFKRENTIVKIGDVEIGGNKIVIMAGPCAVEDEDQIMACAKLVKKLGGKILRGGAFKPRTSPHYFRGLGEKGLKMLAKAREETGLLIVTEVMAPEDVPMVSEYADILQIGTRNMQNYRLLEAAGKSIRSVLLKRGFASTMEEWLAAADYLLKENNFSVILCERGLRLIGDSTRFTLDLGVIPAVKEFSHLPIIVDPSHSAGHWKFVPSLAKAGLSAGADGLLIEIHPDPQRARSDGLQSLTFSDFSRLMKELKDLAQVHDRKI